MAVPTTHKSFTPFHKDTPRVCIILPLELGRISYSMTHFCNRDMISVRCNLRNRSDTIFCSLYMGHEPNKPEIEPDTVKKMANLVEYTKKKNLPLVMGADSNGHHQLWNSFKKNDRRGIILAEMIANLDLSISNKGKSATFLNSRGQKSIIDITLTNKKGSKLVKDWQVSQETSLSDHKMITFSIDLGNKWESYSRNLKEMDENNFARVVKRKMTEKPFRAKIGKYKLSNIDSSVTYLNKILAEALDEVCPMVKVVHKSKIPWSKDLTILKRKAKKAKGRRIARKASAKHRPATQTPAPDSDDESEKIYKKATAIKDKQAYRDFCSNLTKPKDIAKITKQKRKPWEELNVLQKTDGSYTEDSAETLTVLAEEHFKKTDDPPTTINATEIHNSAEDIKIIDNILNPRRLDRVIKKLPLNKAPGTDGIRNNMIKAAWASISQPLSHIYKQCLTYSYCPRTWKTNKGIIIPKEGKDDYTSPRSFRIISLTSNIQKLLERLILDYLERDISIDNKLTKNQFGFRKRKSTEAAIHRLTRKIEDAIQNGHFGLGVFLDVEGAFDNVKYSSIYKAMRDAKIPKIIACWIKDMLTDRSIILTLHGSSITRKIYKGCPQGGILSPLLWNLTLNTLLDCNNMEEDFIQAFADDLAILIIGTDLNVTMRDIANKYLRLIDRWCSENGVKLSTIKTKAIIFSTLNRKYKIHALKLKDETIDFSDEVKYLGVTFDKHLRWDTHIRNKCNHATKLLHMCRNSVAKTWGLSPAKTRWLFKQVVLPTISYACFTWIHRLHQNVSLRNLLEKVQKIATRYITGGLVKSPNLTLDILAGLMPIDIYLNFSASKSAIRLKLDNNWIGGYSLSSKLASHARYLEKELEKTDTVSNLSLIDKTSSTILSNNNFTVHTDSFQGHPADSDLKIFTDGSYKRDSQLAGAGFIMIRNSRSVVEQSIQLGREVTINQAEMFAIYKASVLLVEADTKNQVIHFFTDSLSSLFKLKADYTTSKLTLDTAKVLDQLGISNTIQLYKVPAHTGIYGNEKADKLAKLGASCPPSGPEPFLTISWSNVINKLLQKAKQETHNKIQNHKMKPSSKTPLESYLNRFGSNRLASNKKSSIRLITHMFTDQNCLNNSLNKRNPIVSPQCDYCKESKETAQHFISDCPAHAKVRMCIFGVPYISLEQIISEYGPKKLLEFIDKTGRTNSNYFPEFS